MYALHAVVLNYISPHPPAQQRFVHGGSQKERGAKRRPLHFLPSSKRTLARMTESDEESKAFHALADKRLPGHVVLASWSPLKDLLLVASADNEVRCHNTFSLTSK